MLDAVDDVPTGSFLGEVEKMDGAGRVNHVDGDVADLAKVPGLFVETHEFGDGAGVGGADAPGGNMAW